jgi:hypothetical protein
MVSPIKFIKAVKAIIARSRRPACAAVMLYDSCRALECEILEGLVHQP